LKNPLCGCCLNNLPSQFYYRLEVDSMYDVETKSCSIFTFCETKKKSQFISHLFFQNHVIQQPIIAWYV
jgi:hypothetical protein